MKHFRFQKTLCGPMQGITSPKNKEYSVTVCVGHEDRSIAPLVFYPINGYGSEAIGTVLTVLHVAVQDEVHVM